MEKKYAEAIDNFRKDGGSLLDAMHAVQNIDGYITEGVIQALSEEFGISLTSVYESASFYGMLRFIPPSRVTIQICRNAPCHVAGSPEVIRAFEEALGISIGSTPDGLYTLEYSECIGQCQSSPSVIINEKLYTKYLRNTIIEARAVEN